jgi:hypothetical protein
MSQREAENLLLDSEGRLCVRFYRRADGSVLTKDCPVGWKAIRQRVSKMATAFASLVFAALSGIGLTSYFANSNEQHTMGTVSRIETSTMGEIAVKETNANVAVQEQMIPIMGGISVEDVAVVGRLDDKTQIKQELRKKRRH